MDTMKGSIPSILMLPWLAHGHISPFLELAKRLTQNNFHVYICSTPINLKTIKTQSLLPSIKLIEIHLPSSQLLPPHHHTTKDLPPHLMSALKTAFDEAKPAFSTILNTLKPSLVIYDFLQPWAPQVALENIRSILFLTISAANTSLYTHMSKNPNTRFPFSGLSFTEEELKKNTRFMHDTANGLTNEERFFECIERSSSFVLVKTTKELEAEYITLCSVLLGKEIVPVGPLVQDPINNDDESEKMIMDWMNKKDPASVVFVSFGSEYFLSKEEIEEIAYGLELSKVDFLWVVRFHGEEKISGVYEVLPKGFKERVGEKGMVVHGWAPQGKILGHGSVGGFVSHCGWSSTLEGVMFGVPIIAMPMQLDQPFNAKLVVEVGVGEEVDKENGRYKGEEMARVIRQVVVQEEGKKLREKGKMVSKKLKENGDEEMHLVVEKLLHLIAKA